ncbi:MAG: DUF99 family protein [Nanoarchaeota archaeon]|nr:DUF99 family protein [Nanoarchaeota archaeon]MBU1270238.1 DUF99 family protein [Nanoarchaeota archaeon]MBU1604810.1 DUF99 family protein [Nanoarchaeota archaeon]MBU2442836.1 DUF99 family protein [Nanoarchaeota archaeon]
MKRQIRIIGIDDGPFDKKNKGLNVLVVGTIFRGGDFMDGLVSCYVKQDGTDATRKIALMINNSKFKPQLQFIFIDGIAVGGFNIINIKELSEKTGLPVINIIRDYPDYKKFFKAMDKAGKLRYKSIIEELEKPVKVNNVYVQYEKINIKDVKELLKITCTHSNVPEPLRIAHLIATGVVDGESRGRS